MVSNEIYVFIIDFFFSNIISVNDRLKYVYDIYKRILFC